MDNRCSTLLFSCLFAFFGQSAQAGSPAPIELQRACGFALLGPSIGNSGATTVSGDIGSPSQSGFSTLTLSGTNYYNSAATTNALADLQTAFDDASSRMPTNTVAAELGTTTLTEGVYHSPAGTFSLTGELTLDALGNSAAVFIFKADTTLVTAAGSAVLLTRGAQASNVYWVVGSSATLGASCTWQGTLLAQAAITFGLAATLQGRAMALNAAIGLDSNAISGSGYCAPGTPTPTPTPAASPTFTPVVAATPGQQSQLEALPLRTDHNAFDPRKKPLRISGLLPLAGRFELTIHDLSGRSVRTLWQEDRGTGAWTCLWDGRDDAGHWAASGVYLILLRHAQGREMAKAALLRD